MAVEKSYARLGLFVVRRRRTALATAVFLRPAREEPGGDRDGDLRPPTTSAAWMRSSPGPVTGEWRVGQVTKCGSSARRHCCYRSGFDLFLDRLNTIGVNVKRIRQFTDLGGMLRTCGRRWWKLHHRRGLSAARRANESAATARAGFTPDRPGQVASVPAR